MSSFEICNFEEFVAEVTPQAGSLEEAASAQEILIQQVEGYLARLKTALCTDLTLIESQLNGGGGAALPNLDDDTEVLSGRQVNGVDTYFKLVNIGALPNTTTKNVAHNIGASFALVNAYGVGNDPAAPSSIPLVFVTNSAASNNVWFHTDATNVVVVAGTNRSAYTNSFVVLEYYYL